MEITPEEKADELIQKYELVHREHKYQDEINLFEAKQCAIILVNQMLEVPFEYTSIEYGEWSVEYWQKVKEILEKK
tara:strand:- start:356 stop:583 length:228 start_codon:yes stop_codon:yes gene_type:complete